MEKLPWDTIFFKQDVYKADVESVQDLQTAKSSVTPGSLIYAFSEKEIPQYVQDLTDRKVIFAKQVSGNELNQYPVGCVDYDGHNFSRKDIEALAIISSGQSRFRVDKKIDSTKTDQLYRLWVSKAITESQDHRIIGKKVGQDLAGMITIRFFADYLRIDLIAVSDSFKGQGIGGDLIQSCFALAQQMNKKQIQVVTQGDNQAACAIYKKYGFNIIEQKFIYHIHV